jgi:glycosyltransferase involved in cell wall biosynthesis
MVNTHAFMGGAARMAATLARTLDDSGKAAVRFYHCADAETKPPLYGVRRAGSRQMNVILSRIGGSTAVHDMGVSEVIANEAKTADVIHLHNLHGYYLDWIRLLKAISHRPVVWTWHDMWAATGRCGISMGCQGWRSGCNPCPHLNYYPAAWLDRASSEFRRKSEMWAQLPRLIVVAPQEWLQQIAVERGFPPERVVCIPNPVDFSTHSPTPKRVAREYLGLKVDEKYLLFVAARVDDPLKGYRDFLAVVEQTGWRGLVAGGRPTERTSKVKYLGYIHDAKKLGICYSAADALVVPSLDDTSPNTVVESMACGTPVFGFAVGGIPAQMHSRWGGVVRARDKRALAMLLLQQMPNGGKPEEASAEVRAFASARWGAQSVAEQYLALYDRAIATS